MCHSACLMCTSCFSAEWGCCHEQRTFTLWFARWRHELVCVVIIFQCVVIRTSDIKICETNKCSSRLHNEKLLNNWSIFHETYNSAVYRSAFESTAGSKRAMPPKRPTIFFVLQKKTDFRNWPTPRVVMMQKGFAPWPAELPLDPAGDLPSESHYKFALRAHYVAPNTLAWIRACLNSDQKDKDSYYSRRCQLLARNAFLITNRRAIAMMFVRLASVRLSICRVSVCLGRACIVITRCTLALISMFGWIVQCFGHPDTKVFPPIPKCLFPVPPGREVGMDVRTRRSIKR